MERFTLAQAAEWTKGETAGDAVLTAVSTDSRRIPQEALFLPLAGERFDGHDFIGKALENGAAAVMSHRECEEYPVPALYVENTSQALLDLAGGYRMMCGGSVVGVTGSVGKTTTKELLYAVLAQQFRAEKTEGNLNNEIGLPLTLHAHDEGHRGHGRGDGHEPLRRAVAHDGGGAAGYTPSSPTSAPRTSSFSARARASAGPSSKFSRVCGRAALPFCAAMSRCSGTSVTVSAARSIPTAWRTGRAILSRTCIRTAALPSQTTVCRRTTLPVGGSFTAKLSIPGAHNVLNALAAASVGLLMGETVENIRTGLVSYTASGMRQNIYEQNGFRIYADCYNASPDAMEATLGVLGDDGRYRPPHRGARLDARARRLYRGGAPPCRQSRRGARGCALRLRPFGGCHRRAARRKRG